MTVADNIAFGLKVRKGADRPSKAAITEKVHTLLELVQLEGLAGRYPSQLSGGQRQRVALARALAVEPRLLLLDEPFGALDAQVRKDLRRWLRHLHDEMGLTGVFVTHDQEEALEVADEVVVMNKGRIEQIGTPAEIYDSPATPFVYRFLGNVNALPCRVAGGQAQVGGLHIGEGRADGPAPPLSAPMTWKSWNCPPTLPRPGSVRWWCWGRWCGPNWNWPTASSSRPRCRATSRTSWACAADWRSRSSCARRGSSWGKTSSRWEGAPPFLLVQPDIGDGALFGDVLHIGDLGLDAVAGRIEPVIFHPAFALVPGRLDDLLDQQLAVAVSGVEDRFALVPGVGGIDQPGAVAVDDVDVNLAEAELALAMKGFARLFHALCGHQGGSLQGQSLNLLPGGAFGGLGGGGESQGERQKKQKTAAHQANPNSLRVAVRRSRDMGLSSTVSKPQSRNSWTSSGMAWAV
ncbi:ABC-type sulfate/molybdate transport systems [Paramagnetospirillum magneticum AMB-1]|uniref:ABC-type sulfate/molybdate transport systems n=1 Tax=Paramagnetospirillum magneticum (strain ATCC 700264 / AMB-1) TaxID=342108 RepID=Q2W5Q9_PARM1|nr:ABC-type sulfate/molybdate transport systems [Paramagnetospirillum magneticum AMB-1]